MNSDINSVKDDLAFVRGIAEGGGNGLKHFGQTYFVAGIVYGAQLIGHYLQATQHVFETGLPALALGLAPTIVFLGALAFILAGQRRAQAQSLVSRAIGATFGAVGTANLALIAVLGSVALREKSFTIWLLYPAIVFVLQGAAWLVAAVLRKRLWQGAIGLGWFAVAIGMAQTITDPAAYCAVAGIGLFAFMAAPGAAMWFGQKGA